MLLEHIIMFYKIAEEKSISKVAGSNHISQPALSQQMQRLEEELNVKLLERSNRGIELTRAGQVLHKYALQFMHLYSALKEELDNLSTGNNTFHITATSVACNYALPCSLYKVNRQFPDYTFHLSSAPSRDVARQVLDGRTDLGFIVGTADSPELICKPAYQDKIHLVARSDYLISSQITLEILKNYPLILLDESFSSYRLLRNYMKQSGYPVGSFKVLYHLDSTESVKSAVQAGHGVAFLPYIAVKKELYQKQLKIVEIEHFDLDYGVYSVYKNTSSDARTNEIIDYFVSNISKNIC
ncbi:MAG: LysR family transcriptional regulator [Hungatella sp.]|nr:LysR family transcriptional regulator [Hungatella sp.]